jgi:hypothetical protein
MPSPRFDDSTTTILSDHVDTCVFVVWASSITQEDCFDHWWSSGTPEEAAKTITARQQWWITIDEPSKNKNNKGTWNSG